MADYLAECEGVEPIIVDNKSDYPPLLEYYETTPHKVEYMPHNLGNISWIHQTLEKYNVTENFIVTDPDLILDHIPKDWLPILKEGLAKYQFAAKAGFSLEINDLPNTEIANKAKRHEQPMWGNALDDPRFYRADIDTTFALWRAIMHDFPAVRLARPYTAKHGPWYYTKDNIPEDELYYLQTTDLNWNHWTSELRKELGIKGRNTSF
jgi:hypothetical protein